MIYEAAITSSKENEFLSLLESVEDRFENCTVAEATATIIAEQELNWARFMRGVGLDELQTLMEGERVSYVGAKLEGLVKKAKAFFQMALQKLAELTKSFIAKIDQVFRSNDAFVKKYEKDLKGMSVPSNFEFKGYEFDHMKVPTYGNGAITKVDGKIGTILANKDSDYSKESAENAVFGGNAPAGDTLNEKLTTYFYGSKEKKVLRISIDEQLNILKDTKGLKKEAKDSYTKAAKEIKGIIKNLEKAEKEFKSDIKAEVKDAARVDSAFNVLLNYWRGYSSAASQMHGAYIKALGIRNKQAKAICTKLIMTSGKGKEEKPEVKTEGFVNTDAFLGAVEFI